MRRVSRALTGCRRVREAFIFNAETQRHGDKRRELQGIDRRGIRDTGFLPRAMETLETASQSHAATRTGALGRRSSLTQRRRAAEITAENCKGIDRRGIRDTGTLPGDTETLE